MIGFMVVRCLLCGLLVFSVAFLPGVCSVSASEAQQVQDRRAVAKKMLSSFVFVAQGSGVVYDEKGLIVTNHHVAGDITRHRIRFANGQQYWAERLGTDPLSDVCVLKIISPPEQRFPAVSLATQEHLVIGSEVWAVGNPFALGDVDDQPSLSRGTLSAYGAPRFLYPDTIQIDASLNPGNSGGPCVNTQGLLLGVNGMIRTRTGLRINSGIGIAISCTHLQTLLPALEQGEGGLVHRSKRPAGLNWKDESGRLVVQSDYEQFKQGDQVVAIDDVPVWSAHLAEARCAIFPWLNEQASEQAPQVAVQILRGAESLELTLTLEREKIPGRAWHGMQISFDKKIASLQGVEEQSPAARAGLKTGAVISQINGQTIARRLDWLKLAAKLEVGDWLTVVDDGGQAHRFQLLPKP